MANTDLNRHSHPLIAAARGLWISLYKQIPPGCRLIKPHCEWVIMQTDIENFQTIVNQRTHHLSAHLRKSKLTLSALGQVTLRLFHSSLTAAIISGYECLFKYMGKFPQSIFLSELCTCCNPRPMHLNRHPHPLLAAAIRLWISLYVTWCLWGGGLFLPPSYLWNYWTDSQNSNACKIQTAFDSPVKFVQGNPISLTSGSPMTSQVRSKKKIFTIHGSSRECTITSIKTHSIENQR